MVRFLVGVDQILVERLELLVARWADGVRTDFSAFDVRRAEDVVLDKRHRRRTLDRVVAFPALETVLVPHALAEHFELKEKPYTEKSESKKSLTSFSRIILEHPKQFWSGNSMAVGRYDSTRSDRKN